ncbi:MAG: hypothetical protein AB1390_12535 [Nitrospirota bacterium]
MRRITIPLVVLFYLFSVLHLAAAQNEYIAIKSPSDGASVPERPIVEGKVKNNSAQVWVIVHPMETSDYWVQPSVTVRKEGRWRVQVYIGRPGNIDVGKHFEIMAVAIPEETLREGKVLETWPKAQSQSEVIEVIRK